jgi:putative membrane protein
MNPRFAGLALGGAVLTGLIGWSGLRDIGREVLTALAAMPYIAVLHLLQTALCGCAWHALLGAPRPSRAGFVRMRWLRASIGALLPGSGLGAAIVGARLLVQRDIAADTAGASVTLDLTTEFTAQIAFAALGLALLPASAAPPLVAFLAFGLAVAVTAAITFVAVQRAGGMKLVEAGLARLARRWPALAPLAASSLHDGLMRLHRNRRAVFSSWLFHFSAWLLGAAEIWLVLRALGRLTPLRDCIVIESLGMAVRSAGFFVPGALGVQEGGLVLVGALFGLPANTAIVLSMVKRLRDLLFGLPGLIAWQWGELRRLAPMPPDARASRENVPASGGC